MGLCKASQLDMHGFCNRFNSPCIKKNCRFYGAKTNADRIRAMSDEELCDFLHKKTWLCESHQLCVDCPKYHKEKGCLSTDEWLKQPAEVR